MITFESEFFNVRDTLTCGQVFRFNAFEDGSYTVKSKGEIAKLRVEGDTVQVTSTNDEYFENYFDLKKDYSALLESVLSCNNEKVKKVAEKYRGIRILRQDGIEAFFSFLVSQNNNIPKIKSTIEKLCVALGEKRIFNGEEYYAFPTSEAFFKADLSVLKQSGLGYRAEYVKEAAVKIRSGEIDFEKLNRLDTVALKKELLKIKGVGDKVANCVTLFGFGRSDSFPVDTWIEKIYREDFDGKLTDRAKISRYFLDTFKENSGYVQQYLFYAKREKFI